jgi:hypothetical protein
MPAPAALAPGKRPGTHCTGGCVGPRAGRDGWGTEKLQTLKVWKVEIRRAMWLRHAHIRMHAHRRTSLVDTNNDTLKILQAQHLMQHLQTAYQQANVSTNDSTSSSDTDYARGWKGRGSSPGMAKGSSVPKIAETCHEAHPACYSLVTRGYFFAAKAVAAWIWPFTCIWFQV